MIKHKTNSSHFYLDFAAVFFLYYLNYIGKNWTYIYWVGNFITTTSLVLWIAARVQLGSNFSVLPKAKGLTTKGLYSKIRNPVYVFSSLVILGLILPSGNFYQYLLLVIIICIQLFRANKEDKVLQNTFGAEYQKYKSQTWF